MTQDQNNFIYTYAEELPELCSLVNISPLRGTKLVHVNTQLLKQLNLNPDHFEAKKLIEDFADPHSRWNKLSVAQKYGGHQFGGWNPDLGDGRGLLLAEMYDSSMKKWDMHLKGAGPTPYSRSADGRAVLRSTIREYLASEALHHLNIPTSRALCLFSSNEPVYRERPEKGAMMIRVCPSHIRFGHFEYFYHSQQHDRLERLFNYCFDHHFADEAEADNKYLALLKTVTLSTADLIADWQAQGFNHGVMNTDNMSIHGITFDYGPYAFLDDFNPGFICNHSDHSGRYAFDQQPGIALWNLNALAHAFLPYAEVSELQACLALYEPRLQQAYAQKMRAKMGLDTEIKSDHELLNSWLDMLQAEQRDYSVSMRLLSQLELRPTSIRDHFIDRAKADNFIEHYLARVQHETSTQTQRQHAIKTRNPKFILRNDLAQSIIEEAEKDNFVPFEELLTVLQSPFDEHPDSEHLASPPPDWGKKLEISCSS